MPGFDCHAHVFTLNGPFVATARYVPTQAARLETWQAHLAHCRLDGGVLVQPSFLGTDNHELVEALTASGSRFRGIAVVSPVTSVTELKTLQLAGVVGVRWNLVGQTEIPDPGREPWRTHLLRLNEMGLHLELHLEGARLPSMLTALAEHPLRVVVDHFGVPAGPLGQDKGVNALLDAVRRGRTWVKLSAPYRSPVRNLRSHVRHLLDAGGTTRLVWGSDWPWTRHEGKHDYAQTLEWLSEWLPDGKLREAVLSDSPRALYGVA